MVRETLSLYERSHNRSRVDWNLGRSRLGSLGRLGGGRVPVAAYSSAVDLGYQSHDTVHRVWYVGDPRKLWAGIAEAAVELIRFSHQSRLDWMRKLEGSP